jgi:ankyrin repeat protein
VLCSSGLELSAVDSRGYTCAHLAAAHGKCSALQAIFKAGEDIKRVDQRGWTVLHHAAYHGRLGIVQVCSNIMLMILVKYQHDRYKYTASCMQ